MRVYRKLLCDTSRTPTLPSPGPPAQVVVPTWGDVEMWPEEGGFHVLHGPQVPASRGQAGRVDPSPRRVVGEAQIGKEQ